MKKLLEEIILYYYESLKSKKLFAHDIALLKDSEKLQALLDPILSIGEDKALTEIQSNNKYYSLASYVCHVLNENVNLRGSKIKAFIKKCTTK